jgi:hypothetical protein
MIKIAVAGFVCVFGLYKLAGAEYFSAAVVGTPVAIVLAAVPAYYAGTRAANWASSLAWKSDPAAMTGPLLCGILAAVLTFAPALITTEYFVLRALVHS